MNDCSNPQAPNTTVPHLLPYILLRDRSCDEFLGKFKHFDARSAAYSLCYISLSFSDINQSAAKCSLTSSCLTPWETNSADFGLTIMYLHLESVRSFKKNLPLYHRNAQIVLSDSASRYDELLEDSFRYVSTIIYSYVEQTECIF